MSFGSATVSTTRRLPAGYQSGKEAEITSRVAASFVGWEKDHALFGRELEKVIRPLRTDAGDRDQPPIPQL